VFLFFVPAAVSKLVSSLSKKEDWKNSVKAVQEVAKYAEKKDIRRSFREYFRSICCRKHNGLKIF